ncbi:ester cyclase [Halorussus salinisoli]|uniref:ester cyclase n=1 Tax=Halorussus salinisoli TaxID=2558242 RepID=UPI0010C18DF2|nr:ester cyclase [Halorussus salinisoli]
MAEATADAERLVREYAAIWNEGEFSKLSDVVAESFTFTSPTVGTLQGREEVEAYVREVTDGFSDFRIDINDLLSDGTVVMAESTLSGTHDGEFEDIPPTHEEFEIRDMAKFVVEDGKLREERAYFDQHDFLSQLGLVDE